VQVLLRRNMKVEGVVLRRLLLLAALSMAVMLVLAPAAMAQDVDCPQLAPGEAEAILAADPSDPNGLDADNDGIPCEGDDPGATPTTGTDDQYTTTTATQAVSCDQFISAVGNPSQFQAQQFYDFLATPEQQAALDADGDGFACDDLETGVDNLGVTDADRAANTEAPATSTATSTTLPATGGISLMIPAAVLLIGSSILGLAIARRNS
jgi:hypothetical protein